MHEEDKERDTEMDEPSKKRIDKVLRKKNSAFYISLTWNQFREWATCPKEARERARSLRREWLNTAPHEEDDPATKELIKAYLPYLSVRAYIGTMDERMRGVLMGLHMSKSELATALGMTRPTLDKRIKHPETMTVIELLRLCYIRGMRPDEVLGFMDMNGSRLQDVYDSLGEWDAEMLLEIAEAIEARQGREEREQRAAEEWREGFTEEELRALEETDEIMSAITGIYSDMDEDEEYYSRVTTAYEVLLNRDPIADIIGDEGTR